MKMPAGLHRITNQLLPQQLPQAGKLCKLRVSQQFMFARRARFLPACCCPASLASQQLAHAQPLSRGEESQNCFKNSSKPKLLTISNVLAIPCGQSDEDARSDSPTVSPCGATTPAGKLHELLPELMLPSDGCCGICGTWHATVCSTWTRSPGAGNTSKVCSCF